MSDNLWETHAEWWIDGFTAGADRFVEPLDDWTLAALELRIGEFDVLLNQAFDAAEEF